MVAAVVAVAFSWGAVSQVRNRVIQPSIEIPTTVAAGVETSAPETPSTTPSSTVIRVEPEILGGTATTVAEPDSETTSAIATPTTTAQSGGATTTTTTTQAPPTTITSPTTTQPPTTTTTTTVPPETQTNSYQLIGGTVTISHSPGIVEFVSAIPRAGFSTELREAGLERVRVRFESETHTSDFRAEWEGEQLKITQNETGED